MKTIDLSGDVGWEITAAGLKNQLPRDGKEDVTLNIYSFGGSIFEGMALYNVIRDYPGRITARIGAIGASAASFFPLGADKVVARSNSTMMIHKGWTVEIGNADEMKKTASVLEGLDGLMADIYAEKTGKTKKAILKDMASDTWLMGWESIVDYGLADEVEESDKAVIEKSEAMARIEGIKAKMRESGMFKQDIEKAAAWIKTGVKESPAVGGENKKEEGLMNFNEFIDSNPEAKAEYKALIAAARAEGEKETKKAEASRVAGILEASNAVLSDEIMTAIKEGQSVGDYAIAALKMGRTKPAGDNSEALKGINASRQPGEDVPEKDAAQAVEKTASGIVDALKARKNKRR